MRLSRTSLVVTLLLLSLLGQKSASQITVRTIYFLKDDASKQWCGYASESKFKDQIRLLRALDVGAADFQHFSLSTVHWTQTDETGDWAVNDEYSLNNKQEIRTLNRTINILPERLSEEQSFIIRDHTVIQQSDEHYELGTRQTTQKSVDWFKAPPVFTEVRYLPFSPLIVSKKSEIWSKGVACISIEGAGSRAANAK